MFRIVKYLFTAALFMWTGAFAQNQPPLIEAFLEPDSIAIGDQFVLRVEVSKDAVQMVDFPTFKDNKLGDKIEILSESAIDTLSRDGRKLKLAKKYLLTIFDAGKYSMGRFPMLYMDKNITDTIWSKDSLLLEVGTFEIDTLKQTIYDIKQPIKTPLKFGELSGYIFWGAWALTILAVLIYALVKYIRRSPIVIKRKSIEPPHVVAIRALEMLHNQKLWQNGKHKAYFTSLTDILREYVEERYGVGAMEMTSDEIMEALTKFELDEKSVKDMSNLLKMSDLVKFAKYTPDADDNEVSYLNAYYFVEQTKLIDTQIDNSQMESDE